MMKLYNSLTKKKEEFKPLNEGEVTMYVCGPTVYDYAHIGNLASYLTADFLRRFLEYSGLKVKIVKNITDVGHLTSSGIDKMQKGALRDKKTPEEIAAYYTKIFKQDEIKLNIEPPTTWAVATEHIEEMIELIKVLIEKDFAYEVDGDVYFEVSKFKDYGNLSGNTIDKLEEGKRIEVSKKKRSPFDFNLWKKVDDDHLMRWDSPWGTGVPGWHAECSAMSMKYLGDTIDIHTGGEDNIFPHHEDEIAQSEAVTGKEFVKYWVHRRHIMVEGKKMAKSDQNFYTLADLEKKGYNPLLYRMLVFGSYYREKLNFSFKSMDDVKIGLTRIADFIERLKETPRGKTDNEVLDDLLINAQDKFEVALNDDLNTPEALAVIYELVREGNRMLDSGQIGRKGAKKVLEVLKNFDQVFGVIFKYIKEVKLVKIPDKVVKLGKMRQAAKADKNYVDADNYRDKIEELGYKIEDLAKGYKIMKK